MRGISTSSVITSGLSCLILSRAMYGIAGGADDFDVAVAR